jgi:hypothetical protein
MKAENLIPLQISAFILVLRAPLDLLEQPAPELFSNLKGVLLYPIQIAPSDSQNSAR